MITWPVLILVLFSVGCSALAQILLKHGMTQNSVQLALASGDLWRILKGIFGYTSVWGGLLFYGLSAAVWLFVLAPLDVSVAYPFVSLGFLLTMAFGCLLFGEAFTARKLLGTVYLVAGAQ